MAVPSTDRLVRRPSDKLEGNALYDQGRPVYDGGDSPIGDRARCQERRTRRRPTACAKRKCAAIALRAARARAVRRMDRRTRRRTDVLFVTTVPSFGRSKTYVDTGDQLSWFGTNGMASHPKVGVLYGDRQPIPIEDRRHRGSHATLTVARGRRDSCRVLFGGSHATPLRTTTPRGSFARRRAGPANCCGMFKHDISKAWLVGQRDVGVRHLRAIK